ncbi:NADH-quinone oxidoreductase subunit G [Euzebya tangerina]|uniref:NADH-quinone oxidoreductase subunit G n=1 Tax=Euzebya tangerina TaxID=591198 RepID=UPI000E31B6F8|nr:NADH-quinone oxidoreductase subunit G [Euzebya tangerina]
MSDTASEDTKPELIPITIDGVAMEVEPGTLVIRAAEQIGVTIPRFCDHPLLDPVAACRQCLVDVEGARKPTPACSERVRPDMVIRTQETSELAREYQESQMELLLVNHPLDCPQCDKGGECPLQDQALAHGRGDSRMYEKKRVFTKALPINAQIALDRERCVLCARCTRFSKQISGDPFIELFERGALEQVSIYGDQPYESYFAGNVVQICPVGALTSNSYRFGARPFDIKRIPGIAFHDASGANVRHDVRRGVIQRTLARTNLAVNDAWLDDKNRYGYEFVASPERLTTPLVRGDSGSLQPTSWVAAIDAAAEALHGVDPTRVGILTGGRLTDEDAYAVSRFARDVIGTDNVDFRVAPHADDLAVLPAIAGETAVTNERIEDASAVVIVGLEPHEELPLLFLRLRKAWRDRGLKIVVVGPVMGRLEEIAWQWLPTEVGGEAAALEALADGSVDALAPITGVLDHHSVVLAGERLAASDGALPAARALADTVGAGFAWVPRKPGARGAVEAGLLPGSLPGGRPLEAPGPVASAWTRLPEEPGMDAGSTLSAAANGEIDVLWLIGVDPASDFDHPELGRQALRKVPTVIASDLLPTETVRLSDIVFPATAPPERVGSFTNWEGRRQAWPQSTGAVGHTLQDWDILRQVSRALHALDDGTPDLGWETANDVRREAAPLMAATDERGPSQATASSPPTDERSEDRSLAVSVLPMLLEGGTMLTDAKELLESAPPHQVWVNAADAGDLTDGGVVSVTGAAGTLELQCRITPAVAPGTVVVPKLARRELGGGHRFVAVAAVESAGESGDDAAGGSDDTADGEDS